MLVCVFGLYAYVCVCLVCVLVCLFGLCAYLCSHMYLCVCLCMRVCMCMVCVLVYVYVCVCFYVHTCVRAGQRLMPMSSTVVIHFIFEILFIY